MQNLKLVGVLCPHQEARRLIESLRAIFGRVGVGMRMLEEDGDGGPDPDLVIALGGDGTVLRALERHPHTPTLAINFGHVGFLTAGGQSEAEKLIFRLLADDYYIEERVLLVSEFKGQRREVINEVVVKGATKMVAVDLFVDGGLIHCIRGDGAIVGAPTGSTSYLLATGGPIVAPGVHCIIVNGINEHRFASRALILPDTSEIRLRINGDTRDSEMFVSHDGRDKLPIEVGEEVAIRRSPSPAKLIFFERHTFFRNLKERLDW